MSAESIAHELGHGRERRTTTGWSTICPGHDDHNPSLDVDEKNGSILFKCRTGCDQARVIDALKDRGLWPNGATSNGHAGNNSGPGLSLEKFAAAKGFDVQFLSRCGVIEEKGALVFHYLLISGQRAVRQRIQVALTGEKRFIWNKADGRPTVYGLWRLTEARKTGTSDLFLVEGESDSLTLWFYGYTALGVPGSDNCKLLQAAHVAGFRRIFIVRENDHGGEIFERGSVGQLAALEFEGAVRVVEMARANCKDPNELHLKLLGDAGGFKSEFDALIEQARAVELPLVGLEDFDDAAIEATQVRWLWSNRIPFGKLTLFVGPPGVGKSFASLDLVAHMTDGRNWPDGARNGTIATSIIFSAEDDRSDTIKPRLMAQDAVPGHTRIIGRLREANESGEIVRRSFNLQRDLPQLERMLRKYPDAKLVIVDPVSAFMAQVDSYKNAEVRSEILDPLAELAQRYGVAIVAITHFNKGSGAGLERVSGSIAFPAAARAVWGFSRDPDDPTRKLMLYGKSNCGPEMPGLAYRMAPNERGEFSLQWIAGAVSETMVTIQHREQEVQKETASGRGEKFQAARALWLRMLADGPCLYSEVVKECGKHGISETTLKRARHDLGITMKRKGYGGDFRAFLPLHDQNGQYGESA